MPATAAANANVTAAQASQLNLIFGTDLAAGAEVAQGNLMIIQIKELTATADVAAAVFEADSVHTATNANFYQVYRIIGDQANANRTFTPDAAAGKDQCLYIPQGTGIPEQQIRVIP